MLHVRADKRPSMRPLVTSHGANDDRRDRSRFRLAFDWTGTPDPTPWLSVPAAIRYVGRAGPRRLAGAHGRERGPAPARPGTALCAALGIEPPAPDTMLGSMAAVPLAGHGADARRGQALQAALFEEDRIEVPVYPFPVPAALPAGGRRRRR